MHLQNFEKLQSRKLLVKYSACAECEIIHFVKCEISHTACGSVRCEMKFAHIRVSEYFTFAKQIFHSEAISLARRANFVEKSTCERKCFFLVGDGGFGPPKSVTTDLQSAPFGRSGNPPYLLRLHKVKPWSW